MQLVAGGNIQIPAQDIEICIKTGFSEIELDVTAYLLAQGTLKVRGDQDMIFYGQRQTSNQSVVLLESSSKNPNLTKLKINTALLDAQIQKSPFVSRSMNQTPLEILFRLILNFMQHNSVLRRHIWTLGIELKKP
jgi:stress response protein SCP2